MAIKVKVTSEQYAERWGSGLKGAVERIRSGVEAVVEAPGKKAAAKADKWHASISSQATKSKWSRRISEVPLEEWQRAMIQKGVNRIATGVDEAKPKMVVYGEKLIAHQNGLLQQLDTMPDLTLEDSIARATAWIRGMAKLSV